MARASNGAKPFHVRARLASPFSPVWQDPATCADGALMQSFLWACVWLCRMCCIATDKM